MLCLYSVFYTCIEYEINFTTGSSGFKLWKAIWTSFSERELINCTHPKGRNAAAWWVSWNLVQKLERNWKLLFQSQPCLSPYIFVSFPFFSLFVEWLFSISKTTCQKIGLANSLWVFHYFHLTAQSLGDHFPVSTLKSENGLELAQPGSGANLWLHSHRWGWGSHRVKNVVAPTVTIQKHEAERKANSQRYGCAEKAKPCRGAYEE